MNPATRLADLLEIWDVPASATAWEVRGGFSDDDGLSTWRMHAAAMRWLDDVVAAIDGLSELGDPVAVYRAHIPRWHEAVFSFHVFWRESRSDIGVRPPLERASLDALRMFAATLERFMPERPIDQPNREQAAKDLSDIAELISAGTDLSDPEKVSVLALVRAAQRILGRIDVFGPNELRTQISELAIRLADLAVTRPTLWDRVGAHVLALLAATGGDARGAVVGLLTEAAIRKAID